MAVFSTGSFLEYHIYRDYDTELSEFPDYQRVIASHYAKIKDTELCIYSVHHYVRYDFIMYMMFNQGNLLPSVHAANTWPDNIFGRSALWTVLDAPF